MNKVLIPPSINWYESNAAACAPDNTIVYASRNDVVVIESRPVEEPAEIKILPRKHTDRVVCVGVTPGWDHLHKFIVSAADDKTVRVWNLNDDTFDRFHGGHTTRPDRLVGATFAGNDRIVSVSEDGYIIIWRYNTKELNGLNNIFFGKTKVTCISSCPHATWLTAFGLRQGSIVIADLRGSGRIMHRLLCHANKFVTALSWCPAPYNIFPTTKKITTTEIKHKTCLDNVPGSDNTQENNQPSSTIELNGKPTAEYINQLMNQLHVKDSKPSEFSCVSTNFQETSQTYLTETSSINIEETDSNIQTDDVDHSPGNTFVSTNFHINKDTTSIDKNLEAKLLTSDVNSANVPCTIPPNEEISTMEKEMTVSQHYYNTLLVLEALSNNLNTPNDVEKPFIHSLKEVDEKQDMDRTPVKLVNEYLLASTVKGGKSIIIWRAGTDGRKQIELSLDKKQKFKNDDNAWTSLFWLKPKSLLSSTLQNQLIEWNLSLCSSNNNSQKWRLIHGDHSGSIFNILAPFRRYDSIDFEDWRDKNLLNAWTFGKDRIILNTSLSVDRKTLALYHTCTGGILSILSSPLAPNRLAVISGDGCCRLWDICRPHTQYISMPSLLEKLRVSCFVWHPTNDMLFAFGTTEGKVALMNSGNAGKKPTYLIHHFYSPIHKIEWGPLQGNTDNMGLYVLSEGKIVIYDTNKPLNEPSETNLVSDNSIFYFAWKPDHSICAVGTKVGTVILASQGFECLVTLYLESKCIKNLAWHHEATSDVNSGSSCSNWLALSSNELKIYDCSLNIANGIVEEDNYYQNIIASFNEHTSTITCLAWSPHKEGVVASSSEDGSVLVWDVKAKTQIHCCRRSNLESIMCLAWSPVSTDFIITGSKDSTIEIWKLSENLPKEKISKRNRKKVMNPKFNNDNSNRLMLSDASEQENISDSGNSIIISEPKKTSKNILAGLAHLQNFSNEGSEKCQELFDYICKKDAGNSNSENEIVNEANQIKVTQIFGSKTEINTLLDSEKNFHAKNKYANSYEHISLWQGNIGECIKKAILDETLSPWLINLAPMVSPSLWQDACAAYAEQLSKSLNKDAFLIASYYLACHKVESAIEILCQSYKFREALALAKIRFLEDDPVITSIIERWALYTASNGNFDVACQCYIALNRMEDAAKVLFKRSDSESLNLAMELAKKCDNKDLVGAIMHKLTTITVDTENKSTEVLKPLMSRVDLELQLNDNQQVVDKQNFDQCIIDSDESRNVEELKTQGHENILEKQSNEVDSEGICQYNVDKEITNLQTLKPLKPVIELTLHTKKVDNEPAIEDDVSFLNPNPGNNK